MTANTKLYLNCPFCDSNNLGHVQGEDEQGPWNYIECQTCYAQADPLTWNHRAAPRPPRTDTPHLRLVTSKSMFEGDPLSAHEAW